MEAISEARRHLDNAKEFLKNNAKKEDGIYHDKKYVKIAGHTAYTGILLALNELLGEKNRKTPKSVEWYEVQLSKIDKKVLGDFAAAYQILHIDMGYQGHKGAKLAQIGLTKAEKIIDWVDTRLAKVTN